MDRIFSEELIAFLKRYLNFFEGFLALETEKYQDIAQNQVDKLDVHVKAEEALMLKFRGMERERERLMEQAQAPGATFRELLPLFDETVRPDAEQLYEKLSSAILELKEMNLRCNYLTELRLHRIDTEIKKIKNQPELQKKYDAKAREESKISGFISKKV